MSSNVYRSKYEQRIGRDLERRGEKFGYETVKLTYQKPPPKPSTYTPDWELPNGILVESKGYFKSKDRTKMILVKKANPEKDIRFLFQYDNWLTKKKKSKYSDWCIKNGFKYHVGGKIPQSWLDEEGTR